MPQPDHVLQQSFVHEMEGRFLDFLRTLKLEGFSLGMRIHHFPNAIGAARAFVDSPVDTAICHIDLEAVDLGLKADKQELEGELALLANLKLRYAIGHLSWLGYKPSWQLKDKKAHYDELKRLHAIYAVDCPEAAYLPLQNEEIGITPHRTFFDKWKQDDPELAIKMPMFKYKGLDS